MSQELIELENDRFQWSLKTFTEATAISSLKKLREEIKEIMINIKSGKKDPTEYADALMCLLDSAGRFGITLPEIITAYKEKIEVNKSRVWQKNEDNTYSHVSMIGCPEFKYFGAPHIDAICIDGYLWDLDKFDSSTGQLYGGGDVPCPFCQTEAFIEQMINDENDPVEKEIVVNYVQSLKQQYGRK